MSAPSTRRRPARAVLPLAAALVCAAAAPPAPATRADLLALRRQVAVLESDLALSRTRQPYLVLDVAEKRLRFRLLGTTMREFELREATLTGDVPAPSPAAGGASAAPFPAGIIVLKIKQDDPRLHPLTPEEIEAGAADENVADALPPEIPAQYELTFEQPVVLTVSGKPGGGAGLSGATSWWRGLFGGRDATPVRITLRLDENGARELYRALLPGERILVVPPPWRVLPATASVTLRTLRAGRPARGGAPAAGSTGPGVPFRIPPPVTEPSPEATPSEIAAPADGAPADEPREAPASAPHPAPDGEPQPPPAERVPDDPAPAATPASAPESGGV